MKFQKVKHIMKKSVYIVVISVFVCVANFFFFSKLYINAVSEMNVKPHVLIGSLKNTDTIITYYR